VLATSALVFAVTAPAAAHRFAAPLRLQDRVVHAHQFVGFLPEGGTQAVITDPSEWNAQSLIAVPTLRKLGFARGIWESLRWPARNLPAVSAVAQFGSARAAQAVIAAHLAGVGENGGVKVTTFDVSGIPGARGFKAVGAAATGFNVEFADGPYWYYLGEGFPTGTQTPNKDNVVAAARALYARLHGR
jgi:hypothetical protein